MATPHELTEIRDKAAAVTSSGETAASAVAAQAQAAIAARYTMALNRPRNWEQVRVDLLRECERSSFADAAWYRKPVGQGIEGLSIRFVEAALRAMRNVYVETMTVFDDREKRIVRVSVTDLESNVTYPRDITLDKTVERRKVQRGDTVLRERINKQGETVYVVEATEDQLLNKELAQVSKAMRTCGLRLVPGDIQDECVAAILKTRESDLKKDPDAYKRRIIDAFVGVGVSPDNLAEYVGHPLEALVPAEILALQATYQAIKDGETTWKSVIEAKEAGEVDAAVTAQAEKLKAKVAGKDAQAAAQTDRVAAKVAGADAAATPKKEGAEDPKGANPPDPKTGTPYDAQASLEIDAALAKKENPKG